MQWINAGVLLLVVLTAGVVALAALLVWRNGYVRGWRVARQAPPICPHCNYNLSGLSHCRCPECGREYRLDQLWRAPIKKKAVESEQTERTPGTSKRLPAR